ncbi:MAG TPA: GNAT family N-acetyltransferase [Pseudonocardiaceae bacterium]|jgi:RimJ/RimL family protein N-acetyltransferase|nr:GNAT family N-acetyltransferase [Pseudonocardiaceae bacterium]
MTPPELRSSRLRLRPLDPDDVDALLPIYTDPDVHRYFTDKVFDLAGVRHLIQQRLTRDVPAGMGSWVLQREDTVVGIAQLWPAKNPAGVPEIGWLLGKQYWGAGLATEAATAIIEHGFRRLGLPVILALVHRDNAASLRLAKRLGFLDVGEETHHGQPHRVNLLLPDKVGALHHIELRVGDAAASAASLGWLFGELGWIAESRWSDGFSWRHGQHSVVLKSIQDQADNLFDGDIGDLDPREARIEEPDFADAADAADAEDDLDARMAAELYDTSGVEDDRPAPAGGEPERPADSPTTQSGPAGRTALALSAGSAARVAWLTTTAVERDWQLLSIDRYPDAEGPGRQVVYLRTPDGIDVELVGDEAGEQVFEGFGPGSA